MSFFNLFLFKKNKLSIFTGYEICRFASIRILCLWGILLFILSTTYYSLLPNNLDDTYYSKPYLNTQNIFVSRGENLAALVKKTVSSVKYSVYKFGGSKFDILRGIYIIDCSSYVDSLLKTAAPKSYSSLINSTGTKQPNSKNYYDFFTNLSDTSKQYWNTIKSVKQLQPGDILVFCYKHYGSHRAAGHIMVVMDKPITTPDGAAIVSVADSSPYAHSQDTRNHSGIGIGKMMLKIDPKTGQPAAYAWKQGSSWKGNVNFAMARPVDKIIA